MNKSARPANQASNTSKHVALHIGPVMHVAPQIAYVTMPSTDPKATAEALERGFRGVVVSTKNGKYSVRFGMAAIRIHLGKKPDRMDQSNLAFAATTLLEFEEYVKLFTALGHKIKQRHRTPKKASVVCEIPGNFHIAVIWQEQPYRLREGMAERRQ